VAHKPLRAQESLGAKGLLVYQGLGNKRLGNKRAQGALRAQELLELMNPGGLISPYLFVFS
jgi:hypothetical protein